MATEPLTLQPGEHVWARWQGYDRRDHVYRAAHECLSDGALPVAVMCFGITSHSYEGYLHPATGHRCKRCEAWAARHPDVTVRDAQVDRQAVGSEGVTDEG